MASPENRVAVVTGAGGGIGFATARALLTDGAAVVIAERDETLLSQALEALGGPSEFLLGLEADIAVEESVAAVFGEVRRRFGRLDVLVNNAGIGGMGGSVDESSTSDWAQVMAVNATGPYLCSKYALPLLFDSEAAAIVHVSSAFGAIGVRGYPAYSASKGAVIALTRQMAVDYGPRGVRVNAVLPGYIDNDMGRSRNRMAPDEADRAQAERQRGAAAQPLGRQADVDEVASAVLFLAGEAASFITGVCLPVDGGMLASLHESSS